MASRAPEHQDAANQLGSIIMSNHNPDKDNAEIKFIPRTVLFNSGAP